jgi:cell fate regulator YaaT (PSP1 superfamily)
MAEVLGVRFKKGGKIYYFSPAGLDIKTGETVVADTFKGREYGMVVLGPKQVAAEQIPAPLKRILRKATVEDTEKYLDNMEKEKKAFELCRQKIIKHKMPIKLIDVSFNFDVSKIVFYFTAEGRVDFRDLVKDLATVFMTRIEMRQIGVRDEAKIVGGLATCGRILCCHSVLGEFQPVSIKMAKKQGLSLNPTKISGMCGRLMCCLKYENDNEEYVKKLKPPLPSQEEDDLYMLENMGSMELLEED